MVTYLRLLGLVILLNLIRYFLIGYAEAALTLPGLFGAMAESPDYFRTDFTTFHWVTSYLYNFVMWAVLVWLYHLLRPVLAGHEVWRSLKVFGIGFLFFAAVSFIYMNHYSHPEAFYLFSVADAAIVYALVGVANGLLYPLIVPSRGKPVELTDS